MRELKEIDIFIFNTLRNILYEKVPEYKVILASKENFKYSSEYNIYFFMNEFATYLASRIIEDTTSFFVKNSFEYINLLGQSDNCEVLNIVNIGILEILYTEEANSREWIKKNLSETLQLNFEAWSKYYR
ncbi:DUF7674 family protein [Sphingobacterium sp. UBA5789]|uniref:DUF7674 family protein n=1 Tax=Sphingobacterium sp. UBA5789 TaxID=1947503 RepID=UPI0025EA5E07|nr:hypothetical protein [Sphingobacterium sp. UBA5789]